MLHFYFVIQKYKNEPANYFIFRNIFFLGRPFAYITRDFFFLILKSTLSKLFIILFRKNDFIFRNIINFHIVNE